MKVHSTKSLQYHQIQIANKSILTVKLLIKKEKESKKILSLGSDGYGRHGWRHHASPLPLGTARGSNSQQNSLQFIEVFWGSSLHRRHTGRIGRGQIKFFFFLTELFLRYLWRQSDFKKWLAFNKVDSPFSWKWLLLTFYIFFRCFNQLFILNIHNTPALTI